MIILLEGPDNVGKGTQITKLQPLLIDKPMHIMHYTAIKGFDSNKDVRQYSRSVYHNMFNILIKNYESNHFILDRSHIGEVVYSPMYRDYDGSYVYDIESSFNVSRAFWSQIHLVLFIDEPENLIARDDGLSHSIKLDKKKREIEGFCDAVMNSRIDKKKIINIANKTPDQVFMELRQFLNL